MPGFTANEDRSWPIPSSWLLGNCGGQSPLLIKPLTLGKRLFSCRGSKIGKVRTGEFSPEERDNMHMPFVGVVSVDGREVLDLLARKLLLQRKHRLVHQFPQIEVFAGVFSFWIGTDDHAEKRGGFFRPVDLPVCLLFVSAPFPAEERAGDVFAVSPPPVGDVANGFLRECRVSGKRGYRGHDDVAMDAYKSAFDRCVLGLDSATAALR